MESLLSMHVRVHEVELDKITVFLFAFSLRASWGDMGDSDKSKMISRSEMESFSLDTSRFSRNLLNRFMGSGPREGKFEAKDEEEDEEEEVELNLGLSLGGRFGVDKSSKKLMRSSSIAAYLPVVRDDDAVAASSPPVVSYASLVRTSSLPVETEEEWRKRKELQTLRRMEAKRRRSEKQRNLKAERESGGGGTVRSLSMEEEKREVEVNVRGRLDKDHFLAAAKRVGSSVAPPLGMAVLAAANTGQSIYGSEADVATGKGKGSHLSGSGMQRLRKPLSQGSLESHGGSSSSELESRTLQGSSSCGELSPVSIKSIQEGSKEDVGSLGTRLREIAGRTSSMDSGNTSRQADVAKNQAKETGKDALGEMPCVFTKGDGPNGRRVDGILYKYGRGEEVRIMCVCHGTFFSPADFVRHAGCTDVSHPLRHIVVNPNASPFQ